MVSAAWARLRVSIIFLWRHGYWPNVTRPEKYNEWVQWRKLRDRDWSLAMLTDKLHAKAMVADRIGAAAVIPTIWSGDRLPGVAPWPMPFIVKANHGCKQFVVVRSDADWRLAQQLTPKWLSAVYGKWLNEWHYKSARRMLLVEPYVGPENGLPVDYKVFVFNGVANFIQVHLDRGTAEHRWFYFDRDWNRVSLSSDDDDIRRPISLPEMLMAAEKLAAGRDHLRVDFYEVEGGLRFGEFCLFPGSGLDPFNPVALDAILGRCWTESDSAVRVH